MVSPTDAPTAGPDSISVRVGTDGTCVSGSWDPGNAIVAPGRGQVHAPSCMDRSAATFTPRTIVRGASTGTSTLEVRRPLGADGVRSGSSAPLPGESLPRSGPQPSPTSRTGAEGCRPDSATSGWSEDAIPPEGGSPGESALQGRLEQRLALGWTARQRGQPRHAQLQFGVPQSRVRVGPRFDSAHHRTMIDHTRAHD